MLPVAMARFSSCSIFRTSGFVDDVSLSCNRLNAGVRVASTSALLQCRERAKIPFVHGIG